MESLPPPSGLFTGCRSLPGVRGRDDADGCSDIFSGWKSAKEKFPSY